MYYIYNCNKKEILFNKDELKSLLENMDNGVNIDNEFVNQFNDNLVNIIEENEECEFYKEKIGVLDSIIENIKVQLYTKTEPIRNGIVNKYLLSQNLNFLISNGCSLYAGSKPINKDNSQYTELLEEFSLSQDRYVEEIITKELIKERPEIILDRLYEILSYYEKIAKDQDIIETIKNLIKKFKEKFIRENVLTIDYSRNHFHKMFLKRIIARESKLNKPNIFTLNYDLLIEKTAEELGIYVNNGFLGFHNRVFLPSTYHLDLHINQSNGQRVYTKGINLYKLHGSISWRFDSEKPPYGIIEIQLDLNNLAFKTNTNIPECIIYPVQTKKKHSLDLPYSEMFRQFIECVNKPNSTLIIIGYSFWDEHVNDIITNALANPTFNLVIFSYSDESNKDNSPYLKSLFERSREDSRITIFCGNFLGNFEYIVKYLLAYPYEEQPEKIILETFRKLKGEGN